MERQREGEMGRQVVRTKGGPVCSVRLREAYAGSNDARRFPGESSINYSLFHGRGGFSNEAACLSPFSYHYCSSLALGAVMEEHKRRTKWRRRIASRRGKTTSGHER